MANVLKIKDELFVDDFTASPSALRRSGTSATAIPTKHSSRSSGGPLRDVTSQFDYTIWLGDLNFRTAISRLHADWLLQKRDYMTMLQFDELRNLMAGPDNVFNGFVEAPIEFAPTYKCARVVLGQSDRADTTSWRCAASPPSAGRHLRPCVAPTRRRRPSPWSPRRPQRARATRSLCRRTRRPSRRARRFRPRRRSGPR